MKCIQVLPILKHTFSEELTYWTAHDFQIGDLIQIELNHRKIYAIVSSIVSLSEAKEFIKSRDFKIKKIENYIKIDFFSNAFVKACLQTSKYYLRSFGEILSEYIPKNILENLDSRETIVKPEKTIKNNITKETIYIQKTFSEQVLEIKKFTEKYFKICVIVPTDSYKEHIQNNILDVDKDIITILTPIDLYLLDEKDFDLCILGYAGSEYYRHLRKGFDTRYMIRSYCNFYGLQLVEMDSILPIYRDVSLTDIKQSSYTKKVDVYVVDQTISKTAKVQKIEPHKSKKILKKTVRPEDDVDMRDFMESDVDVVTYKKLKLISPELFSLISYAYKQKEDVFIYTTRKGLSSRVVCSDCGHVLTCNTCKKPYVLKHIDGVIAYECINGHEAVSIDSVCPICGSIHLQGLGSGTDALFTELSGVTSMPIITIDGNNLTQSGARNIFKKRKDKNHKPTIYIGTDMAIHQGLEEKFSYTAVASIETLLSLPNAMAELDAARVLESVIEKTIYTCLIQTRKPKHIIWRCLQNKSWNELITQVKTDTKDLGLPPNTSHIQILIPYSKGKTYNDFETIKSYLEKYENINPIYIQDELKHVIHIYLKEWTISSIYFPLYKYLKSLPKHVRIEVDSPSLLTT